MLRIGTLRERVRLESQVRTADGMGAETVTWKDEGTVWAAIWPAVGSEAVKSGQLSFDITHRVRIRHRDDIRASWRVYHKRKGQYFTVRSILNPEMKDRMLDLLCKETET